MKWNFAAAGLSCFIVGFIFAAFKPIALPCWVAGVVVLLVGIWEAR